MVIFSGTSWYCGRLCQDLPRQVSIVSGKSFIRILISQGAWQQKIVLAAMFLFQDMLLLRVSLLGCTNWQKPAKLAVGCWIVVLSSGTINLVLSSQGCVWCRGSGVQVSTVLRFLIRNACPGGWMLQEERGTILQCGGLGMRVCLSCVLELFTGDVTDVTKHVFQHPSVPMTFKQMSQNDAVGEFLHDLPF